MAANVALVSGLPEQGMARQKYAACSLHLRFTTRYSYQLDESIRDQTIEIKRFAVEHYTNAARDLIAVITKRG